ncbi:integrase catalytic domain-containing protein [Trichonephila clavata]|uniref:Integrase catalytic domain-containing protein n=1 Tax=Trichonephila clavata TaxID=2740835 RepID=A0A8X6J681_TRICU|nr:integrase catalytic domain-containing protein [Trichonephila clavata]
MNFYITADEIQNAEYFWLKYVQYEFYSAEILTLKCNELRCSSEIKSLKPYLDADNLLRITGRLLEADLCFGEKHPVILPRHCKFTELLVIREHERIGHCGSSETLTQLRKNYWIPKGHQLVKTMIRICLICKKYNAKPADQLSGQLPRDRITQSPPFQIVGIDFTGAILVTDNQETHKSYVSLFTCAVTCAIHLELVSDMPTKCFLLALQRFLARRGNCKVIYSDNARTLKAAEKELAYFANILKDSKFQNFVTDKGGRQDRGYPFKARNDLSKYHDSTNFVTYRNEGKSKLSFFLAEANLSCNVGKDAWIVDTAASNHFTNNKDLFINFVDSVNENMVLAVNNVEFPIEGKGDVKIWFNGHECLLRNVLFSSKLRKNLMSGPMLDQNGLKFIGENWQIKVYAGNKLIFKANLEQGLYYAYPDIEPKYASSVEKTFKIEGKPNDLMTWHERFGHANVDYILKTSHLDAVRGLAKLKRQLNFECESCRLNKYKRVSLFSP